jgi:hypothetical protein
MNPRIPPSPQQSQNAVLKAESADKGIDAGKIKNLLARLVVIRIVFMEVATVVGCAWE